MFDWMAWFFDRRSATSKPVSMPKVDPWEVIYDGETFQLQREYDRPWLTVPFFERDFEYGRTRYRLALLRIETGLPARVSVHVYMQIPGGFTSEHFWIDDQGFCFAVRDDVLIRSPHRDLKVAMRYFHERGLLPIS
ncbi:MAG: hypothetical protein QG626_284 [Patescibacteria group bacterium]|nr:hypothetical protein [Patescibacteria group bacterium]